MKTWTRLLALLLAAVTVLSLVCSGASTTLAAEIDGEEDTYELDRIIGSSEYNIQYASPYVVDYYFSGSEYEKKIQTLIFSMYHTKTRKVTPAYCVDIKVEAEEDHIYHRLNLEDSTYAGSVAGKLRAIVRHGFYINSNNYTSDADHETAVAARVAAIGAAAGVENLTPGEAITATQCALWKTVHGSSLSFPNFARDDLNTNPTSVKYFAITKKEILDPINLQYGLQTIVSKLSRFPNAAAHAAEVRGNIETVYNYLLALPPETATGKVVSASSFAKLNNPELTDNGDGTYDMTITTTIDVEMTGSDYLTLEADLNNKFTASTNVSNGKKSYSLSFYNVPAEQAFDPVYLTLSGRQTPSYDVYLFATENRDVAQTMVGMDNSQMTVYARVQAVESRSLRITKTTESGYPLSGIIFDIYPSITMDEYLNGAELPDPYDPGGLPEYTVITDKNGYASFNFTQMGLPDGFYLLVERENPAIVAPLDPFYVVVPATNDSGTGYDYEVSIYPKNAVKGDISIGKDVVTLGNDEATVNAAEPHTWIITTSIPEDIDSGISYVISDTLDNRLNYMGNVKLAVESADGETTAAILESDTDYTLRVTDVDSLAGDKPADHLEITLTRNGMTKIATTVGTGSVADYRLRTYFDAQINANAQVAAPIPNQSKLEYTNSVNMTFRKESDQPIVYTGGINLKKVDADNGKALAGANFKVYRSATQEELAANVEGLMNLAGVSGKVIQVSFYSTPDLSGTPVTVATSDVNGNVAIYGLAYGKYYAVETVAPAGYNTTGDPIELTLSETSHLEASAVTVRNTKGTVLPETGGTGTGIYTVTGAMLMAASLLLLWTKKRKVQF